MKNLKTKIEIVYWEDITSLEGWRDLGNSLREETLKPISIGFIIGEDEKYLRLAQTIILDQRTVGDVLVIPKQNIVKRVKIK